jgi:MFS family permease
MKYIGRYFPHTDLPNVRYFYIVHLLSQSFFITAVWLFFWLKFLNYEELGFIDGLAFLVGWFAEIPSGILADRYGRKPLIVLAGVCIAAGCVLQAEATSAPLFFVAESLYLIGFSFYSGSGEALLYDSLASEQNQSSIYENVLTAAISSALVVDFAAGILGALAYQLDEKLPFYLSAFVSVLFSLFALRLQEKEQVTLAKEGKRPSIFALVFTLKLSGYLLIAFGVTGLYYAFSWGFIRPAMATHFGLREIGFSLSLATALLATFYFVRYIPLLRKSFRDTTGFLLCGVLLGCCFIAAAFITNWWGALLFTIMAAIGNGVPAWISIVVNQDIPSERRATLISSIAFVSKLPYVLIAWWGGTLLASNQSGLLYSTLGILSICFTVWGVLLLPDRGPAKTSPS